MLFFFVVFLNYFVFEFLEIGYFGEVCEQGSFWNILVNYFDSKEEEEMEGEEVLRGVRRIFIQFNSLGWDLLGLLFL